jgi:hypothetical protein
VSPHRPASRCPPVLSLLRRSCCWFRCDNRGTVSVLRCQVPRDYHIGRKGTFMNEKTHRQYFENIATNVDPSVDWSSPAGIGFPLCTQRSDCIVDLAWCRAEQHEWPSRAASMSSTRSGFGTAWLPRQRCRQWRCGPSRTQAFVVVERWRWGRREPTARFMSCCGARVFLAGS